MGERFRWLEQRPQSVLDASEQWQTEDDSTQQAGGVR